MGTLTSPALRYARRVTPELHFTGSVTSNVNCGAIHNASAKLWVSFWFKLDTAFSSSSTATQFLFGKYITNADYLQCFLFDGDGTMRFKKKDGDAEVFNLTSAETSWSADAWYHVIVSISDIAKARMVVMGGTAVTSADGSAAPNGGDLCLGDYDDPGAGTGLIGEVRDGSVGTDDLTVAEERDLSKGIIPDDADEFYRLNEGHGVVANDLRGAVADGAIDTACTWETGLRQYVRW